MANSPILREYGVATTVPLTLFEIDGVDMRIDAVAATGDIKITKDEGAEANTTNLFVDEGSKYSIALTATEMQSARISLILIDQTATKVWLDTDLTIETYGNASAQHAVNLNDSVRAGLTALPNAAADAAGGLPISDAGGLDLDSRLDADISSRLAPTVAARTLDVTATGTAGIDWANVESQGTSVNLSSTTTNLVNTTTTNTDMRGTDGANTTTPPTAAAITDAVWDELQSGHTTANTFGKFLDVEVSSVSGGGGLTQQNVRDAMKLTPTAGAPSTGSVDEHLDDILTDTGTTIPTQITALNDVAATDIVSAGAITTLSGAVANVDLVDTCTVNTDMRGTNSALLSADINLTAGAVDNVTLVATTTTNTDMRGTDGANTVTPDAAGVAPTVSEITTDIDANSTQLAAILLDTGTTLPALIDDLAIKKNTAFSNFEFLMVLTSDGRTPATGLTVTGQRSVDGGSFTSVGGTIAEVSNGIYQFDALAADTNGDVITWRFLSATADDTFVTFKTVA